MTVRISSVIILRAKCIITSKYHLVGRFLSIEYYDFF